MKKLRLQIVIAGWCALVIIGTESVGQTFTRSYGGASHEYGRWITETPDSGFVIGGNGSTVTNGFNDIWIVRTDHNGDTLWTQNYGGTANELFASVEVCPDSGLIIAGTTYSYGSGTPSSSNWYAVRTNKLGDTLWTKTYGNYSNDLMYHAKPTADGGFLLMGYTDVGGWAKGTVIKVNQSGYPIWTHYMGSSGNSYAYESIQDTSGEHICTGSTLSGTFQVSLQRLTNGGTVVTSKSYHSSGQYADGGVSITPAHGGGYMVLGLYGNYGSYNAWLLRVDNNLDTLWTRKLAGMYSVGQLWNKDISIAQCSGGYLLCGSGITSGHTDIKLCKLDTAGNLVWTKYHGGTGEHYGFKAIVTSDGGFAAAGWSYLANNADFMIVKTDSAGNVAPQVPPVALAGNNGTICAGDTFLLSNASATNYSLLKWTTNGSGVFNDTSILNPVYYPSPSDQISGSVLLTLTASAPGYNAAISSCTLTIYPLPVTQISGLDTAYCLNDVAVQGTGTPTGGAFSGAGISPSGLFSPMLAGAGNTVITYNVTDPITSCTNTATQIIIVHPLPLITLTSPTTLQLCQGDSSAITVSISPADSCHWLFNNIPIGNHTDTILPISVAGAYMAVATSPFGCQDTSATVVLNLNPLPQIDLGADTMVCAGTSVMLDAGSGFFSQLWSNGTTASQAVFDSSGTGIGIKQVWIQVTNAFGCRASDSVLIHFIDCSDVHGPMAPAPFSIFPNPVTRLLNIHLNASDYHWSYFVVSDMTGKTMLEKPGSSATTVLDLSGLKPGPYLLMVKTKNQTSTSIIIKLEE